MMINYIIVMLVLVTNWISCVKKLNLHNNDLKTMK